MSVIERDQAAFVTNNAQTYGTIRRGRNVPATGNGVERISWDVSAVSHAAILPREGILWLGNWCRGRESNPRRNFGAAGELRTRKRLILNQTGIPVPFTAAYFQMFPYGIV